MFLPAADIPTFVGEGRVDLGITGRDQVQEHDASVARARRASLGENGDVQGCEEVLDLGFGSCKLQVQVPEKGPYTTSKDLIGKNICTSFVHLSHEFFAALEREGEEDVGVNGNGGSFLSAPRTKITELSGSVEAACALGVADGIVDLVGTCLFP